MRKELAQPLVCTCQACGQQFESWRSDRTKYCSRACNHKDKRKTSARCTRCKAVKPVDAFERLPTGRLRARCEACRRLKPMESSERLRRWREANPEAYARHKKESAAAGRAKDATPEGRKRKQERERRRYHANKARYSERAAARYRRNAETIKARVRARREAAQLEGFRGVLRRDPCAYCGGSGGHLDHIMPTARGGPDTEDNLTSSCRVCNSSKHARPLLLFLLDT